MTFQTTEVENDKIVVIKLPERVSGEVADQLKVYIREIVEKGRYKLVMNLAGTTFMDSSGLGALVSKIAVTRANNGDVRLAHSQEYITNLLELTHLDQVMKTYPTVIDAVRSFKE
jgi:anti-sigma B factor antagonist